MKKESVKPNTINLLRKHHDSVFDQIFSWALSVGRLLVIITQFIALGAFIFRIVLDRQIIDLNDVIENKQIQVKVLEPEEAKYRALITQLKNIKSIEDQAGKQERLMSEIVDIARGKMEFNSLNATEKSITIDGSTRSVGMLQRLINEYKAFPGVTSVNINSITTLSGENKIKATFSLSFVDVNDPVATVVQSE